MFSRPSVLVLLFILAGLSACSGGSGTPTVVVENEAGTPIAAATATPTPPENLVQNGDFQQHWQQGWERFIGETIEGQSVTEVVETTAANSGKAIRLNHNGPTELRISQFITMTTLDVTLRAKINLSAESTCWGLLRACTGLAGFVLTLHPQRDTTEATLGQLVWLNADRYNEDQYFESSGSQNYTFVKPGWYTIDLNLQEAIIDRLPAVDSTQVQAVSITLIAGTSGECKTGECPAEIHAADIELLHITP
ncbi:MAG: hypothetical protein HC837_11990 [Chloroflexaceae bacterium]|nr:hypothetical protein [Chloroflexaceae bacterium]